MTTRRRTIGLASLLAFGCTLPDRSLGKIGESTGEGDELSSTSGDGASGPVEGGEQGESTGETSDVPVDCDDPDLPPPSCGADADRDAVHLQCDNAPKHFNPDQADIDDDGIADAIDLCAVVADAGPNADSDQDGVGNQCDSCRQTLAQYNDHDAGVAVPDYMLVRNIPWQGDADEDGIGDVCDNCVALPNCEDYGPDNPYEVGNPIAYDDEVSCQRDDDADLLGDACAGQMNEGAAGPVGIGPDDDFDQDGIVNVSDACPRQPLPERIACTAPSDCPVGSACEDDICDHVDEDDDQVGDICDSCPSRPNPAQTMDGAAQEEDADGDFVADICETNFACSTLQDPPPMGFYEVSVGGACCTVLLAEGDDGGFVRVATGAALFDPDGLPIRSDCSESEEEARMCRPLPASVATAPGVLALPHGCDEALADAGLAVDENRPLGPDDFGGSLDALWATRCALPQWDQDFDGLGDACDFCAFAFDPDNQVYVDDGGTAWPGYGKFCYGEYDPEVVCEP